MSELAKRLAKAKEALELTNDQIVERAARAGFSIDRSTVSRYITGKHGPRLEENSLSALAAGLDLDVRELRELAGRPAGEKSPYVPPAEAASLTRSQRRALDALIKAIVAEQATEQGGGDDAGNAEAQKSSGGDEPLAAIVDLPTMAEMKEARKRRTLEEAQPATEAAYLPGTKKGIGDEGDDSGFVPDDPSDFDGM